MITLIDYNIGNSSGPYVSLQACSAGVLAISADGAASIVPEWGKASGKPVHAENIQVKMRERVKVSKGRASKDYYCSFRFLVVVSIFFSVIPIQPQ